MKRVTLIAFALLLSAVGTAHGATPNSGPGMVSVGVDASEWSSDTPAGNGIYPIGGSGQVNGEFTTVERYGIEIGLRAQDRFEGTLQAVPSDNGKVGIYEATTGFSTTTRATWNYDWHVDLRDAHGVAADTTLNDYDLTLDTDIAPALFGDDVPVDLTFGGTLADEALLYQQSWNPDFGNDVFDPTAEDTYYLRLVLTPRTFNGPALETAIQVNVSDPAAG